jgi:hypothetical protein
MGYTPVSTIRSQLQNKIPFVTACKSIPLFGNFRSIYNATAKAVTSLSDLLTGS